MKYIEAEKLIAEIDNIIEMAVERWDNEQVTGVKKLRDLLDAKIDSLQQEQPEVGLDALVNEAFDKYSSVDGYGQLSVSFNRAELYSFIKKLARKEE